MTNDEHVTKSLNDLLRGELSAVETYNHALENIKSFNGIADLKCIHQDHQIAASRLKDAVVSHGGEPSTNSGPWGIWANMMVGTARVFGEQAVLKILKEGEEHGIKEYRGALENGIDQDCARVIETLIPKQQEHLATLNRYLR